MTGPREPAFPLRDLLDFQIESAEGTCRAWLDVPRADTDRPEA